MSGKIGEIKLIDIEVKKDGETLYNGIGAEVPDIYKVEFQQVKVNNEKIIYYI